MTRAALYLRISLDRHGEGLGIERQREACEELVRRRGWRVAAEFADNDTSAYSGKPRPGYDKLVRAMRDGAVDVVVVYAFDRLVRRLAELEEVIDLAEETGVALAPVTGDVDLESASGRTYARVLGSIAQGEVETLIERVRRKVDQNVRAGQVHNGGRRPFGYEPDRRTVVPEEAEIIREMTDRVIGGESLRSIATDLDRRGVQRPYGGAWTSGEVRNVLTKPRLCGRVVHRGEVVPNVEGAWPAILDEDTFDRLQVAVAARRRKSERWTNQRRHLLSGLLHCAVCDATMRAYRQHRGVWAYRCVGDGCVSRNLAAVDEHVTSELIAFAREHLVRVTEWDDREGDEIATRIAELEARQNEAAEQFADGSLPANMLRTIGDRLQQQIDELREQQVQRQAETVDRPWVQFDLGASWDGLSLDEKRDAIRLYVRRVVVHRAKAMGPGFDPSTVTIEFRDPEQLEVRGVTDR